MHLDRLNHKGRKIFIDDAIARFIPRWQHQVLKEDWDKVFLVDGREGAGKSVLAQQLAAGLDPEFNIDKIVFTGEDLIKKIRGLDKKTNRKRGDCFILDEAFGSINSRQAMSSINRAMIQLGTEMRHFNLFIIIVLPYFFDLDKYYAIARANNLFHVYCNKQEKRGWYKVYAYNAKKTLYLKGKKEYNYGAVRTPFSRLRFSDGYVVDKNAYDQKKTDATTESGKQKVGAVENRWKDRCTQLVQFIKEKTNISDRVIAEFMDTGRQRVQEWKTAEVMPLPIAQ